MRNSRSLLALIVPAVLALPLACSSTGRTPFEKGSSSAAEPAPSNSGDGLGFEDAGPAEAGPNDEEVEVGCNPSASRYDVPGNDCDDDNDGEVDNELPACDEGLSVGGNAGEFARALGLCQTIDDKTDDKWGVLSAKYTKGFNQSGPPADGQHGILPGFGPLMKPRHGEALGVLSTGWARVFDSPTGLSAPFKEGGAMQTSSATGALPPGFPQASTGCPAIGSAQDISVLRLEIKTPKNAKGFEFDFDFYSGEWPEYVCSRFNDGFIAYLKSAAFNNGTGDNVSFDGAGAPVSVNNAFFDRCTPNTEVGCLGSGSLAGNIAACPGGSDEIAGTGFSNMGTYCGSKESTGGGATGWLTSQAPVKGGEVIVLEFYIWDSGDARYNSSVLLDNFRWIPKPVEAATGRPK